MGHSRASAPQQASTRPWRDGAEQDRAYYSRLHVADLRAAAARRGDDRAVTDLVRRLTAASTEFAELWQRHEVGVRRNGQVRVIHPAVGLVSLDCEQLLSPAEDQHLLLFTAAPGSRNAEQLALLRVVGRELFPAHKQTTHP